MYRANAPKNQTQLSVCFHGFADIDIRHKTIQSTHSPVSREHGQPGGRIGQDSPIGFIIKGMDTLGNGRCLARVLVVASVAGWWMWDADGFKLYTQMESSGWGMTNEGTQAPVYDFADFGTLATGSADILRAVTEAS